MPIIDVTLVLAEGAAPPAPSLARELADALGAALGCEPGRLWVRLHELPAACYAENGSGAGPDAGGPPVFVEILHADLPQAAARAAEARVLCDTVAHATGRPAERVHVEYAPPGRGRIAFGGKLIE